MVECDNIQRATPEEPSLEEPSPAKLSFEKLSVAVLVDNVQQRVVVRDLSVTIPCGAVCALIGPNGSGKSSLVNACMGHPWYTITAGTMRLQGKILHDMTATERARLGMMLISQQPVAIPGLAIATLLAESYRAIHGSLPAEAIWQQELATACRLVGLPDDVLERHVGVEFSGGQKKRVELLQLLVLRPTLVLLDELDSGLDQEGVALLGNALRQYRQHYPATTMVVVSHHHQLFSYIEPTMTIHLVDGAVTSL
ncbi:ATP-binding cassette domain-containing protein [Candidatus Dependentiae bacterium]|nr:ATP-binding cassette domain-containing protein [Candidatus Dependentiae bacterium]